MSINLSSNISQTNHLAHLPENVWLNVLYFLNDHDVLNCMRASKSVSLNTLNAKHYPIRADLNKLLKILKDQELNILNDFFDSWDQGFSNLLLLKENENKLEIAILDRFLNVPIKKLTDLINDKRLPSIYKTLVDAAIQILEIQKMPPDDYRESAYKDLAVKFAKKNNFFIAQYISDLIENKIFIEQALTKIIGCLIKNKQIDAAEKLTSNELSLNAATLSKFVQYYAESGDISKAEAYAKKNKNDYEIDAAYYSIFKIVLKNGDISKALEFFKKIVYYKDKALSDLVVYYGQLGDISKSNYYLEQIQYEF